MNDDFIERYLGQRDLTHVVSDGVYVVPYGGEDEPPTLIVLIWSGEAAAHGVMVELHNAIDIAPSDEAAVLARCNNWNRTSRATKARLEPAPLRRVVLESWMPLTDEVPDQLVERFLDNALFDMLTSWTSDREDGRVESPVSSETS
jgi:hypothetical protein